MTHDDSQPKTHPFSNLLTRRLPSSQARSANMCRTADCPNRLPGTDLSRVPMLESGIDVFALMDRALHCAECNAPEIAGPRQERAAVERERRVAEERAHQAAVEEDIRRGRVTAVLDDVPPRYSDLDLDQPTLGARVRSSAAMAEAAAALVDGMTSVTLVGAAGSGKSTLGAAMLGTIVKQALARDEWATRLASRAMWVSAPALALARRVQRLGDGEAPLVQRAMNAWLLVIDDLGMERDIGGALTDILTMRHDDESATIVTTGLGYAALVEKYGDGIARRLTERTSAVLIHCSPKPAAKTEGEAA